MNTDDLEKELAGIDSAPDMESLNLFGVNIEDFGRSSDRQNSELKKILSDLVKVAQEVDPNGATRDFTKRKAFNYYDPYNPDESRQFAGLKYEDEIKLRASLVIDVHKKDL